jgi:hypothetical protein
MNMYKIEFYVPVDNLEEVKTEIFSAGAGHIGNYENCCWVSEGIGQFRPVDGSSPHIGELFKVEKVKEYKVELVCRESAIENVINALVESHPYETPAYQYWLINNK